MADVLVVGVCDAKVLLGKLKEFQLNFGENIVLLSNSELDSSYQDSIAKEFNVEVTLLITDDIINGLFHLKCAMDRRKVNNAVILSASSLLENVEAYCKEVFPDHYSVQAEIFSDLEFSQSTKQSSSADKFKSFLSNLKPDEPLALYRSPVVPDIFVHGFSSRAGGLTAYPGMASLNMCFSTRKKDSRAVVKANHSLLAKAAGFDCGKFVVAKAAHGNDVWVYEKDEPESYDAIVTNSPGVVVAAPGADCNMLIFADSVTKVCGAAHAGWKGILKGIIESTITSMVENYGSDPKNIKVVIGPSLSVCCLEFGTDGIEMFSPIHKNCVVLKEGHPKPFIDLRFASIVLLEKVGIPRENIDESSCRICSKCDPEKRFFSYRRDGVMFGNQVGFIGVK